MGNLLVNPGFDEPYQGSHECLVFPEKGEPYRRQKGEVQNPEGWLTWYYHDPGNYDEPEVTHMLTELYPERVQAGAQSMRMFTFNRRHSGGFMQRVEVAPERFVTVFLASCQVWKFKNTDSYFDSASLTRNGSYFALTAYAHAWSNHEVEGYEHYGDARCSVGVGCGPVYIPYGEAPEQNGDPLNDAIGNFRFQVGIDPYGGENPFTSRVVWNAGAHIYNGYHSEPLRLTVRVPGLVGMPREQYERVYVLLPPGAGADWANAVVNARWDTNRWTIGASADDAGIGDLDYRTVVAINPHLWEDDLCAWFAEHYPGVAYAPLEAATPDELERKLGE